MVATELPTTFNGPDDNKAHHAVLCFGTVVSMAPTSCPHAFLPCPPALTGLICCGTFSGSTQGDKLQLREGGETYGICAPSSECPQTHPGLEGAPCGVNRTCAAGLVCCDSRPFQAGLAYGTSPVRECGCRSCTAAVCVCTAPSVHATRSPSPTPQLLTSLGPCLFGPAAQVPTCQRGSSSAEQSSPACPNIPASCAGIVDGQFAEEAPRLLVSCCHSIRVLLTPTAMGEHGVQHTRSTAVAYGQLCTHACTPPRSCCRAQPTCPTAAQMTWPPAAPGASRR